KNMTEEKGTNIKEVAKKLSPKSLMKGELLQYALNHLPFLLYVAGLMIVYIAYGYYADNTIRKLSAEQKKSDKLYSELQSLMEIYNQKSLQSAVAEQLEVKKIFEAKDPPRVIWIKED